MTKRHLFIDFDIIPAVHLSYISVLGRLGELLGRFMKWDSDQ